ncbi:RasGAP C-terminus-domain-containing protein [Radiomyces spectabilis]|uniref:RasGAP C-terminus-domain-containing protein n=1 Tax=Radiomyces spectabilis TaxID=64574 RepID=UPI00221E66CC|nr:RasGAP C-terminus-domain-containing protein [Radiomyces spectabilis]KAI8391606.1 RasGAP C-terminus-domain-containing protein [Radiomyces spectabilis]
MHSAPEQYDVIQAVIHPVQRRNLAEISKMLQAVSSGRLFTAQDMFLAPLNDYVAHATKQFNQWFMQLTDVESPEEYFNQHSLADQVRTEKPRVYISPTELFHLHYALQVNLRVLEPEGTGKLHGLLQELGDSPYMPNMEYPESTICLSLTNPSNDLPSDPAARIQQLQVDAKRLVIYVIKVQSGTHLQEIFEAPVTPDHEAAWTSFKKVEFSGPMGAKRQMLKLSQSETPLDLQNIKFFQLKSIAQKLVIHLERLDVIPQSRHHQEMINMIAQDITGKNRRRVQRDREISRIRLTLHHLEKKHQYLLVQGNQYEDYLMSCMTAMATKRGQKQRMVLPFSRQYFHLRGLQKQGMVPKFGSYKYTAKELYDRGVLVELSGIDRKHYDRISMVFSMDQAGIITIEGTYSGWSLSSLQVDVRYEELLQTQFEGIQYIQVLDDMAKANVNLLIYLINKKFYA